MNVANQFYIGDSRRCVGGELVGADVGPGAPGAAVAVEVQIA